MQPPILNISGFPHVYVMSKVASLVKQHTTSVVANTLKAEFDELESPSLQQIRDKKQNEKNVKMPTLQL